MTPLLLNRILDSYRSQLNPLRGLTIRRVVSLLEEGERGAYADLQWLYRFVEKRDATLRGVKRRLRSAVTKLDWDIKVIDELPAGKQAVADRQHEALRLAYERVENLREALAFLSLAELRGYAHLEKVFEKDGNGGLVIARLEPVPQWHWCRDGLYSDWTFNPESASGLTLGEPVDLEQFVIREVEDPIDEIAVIAFIRKNLSQKDWDGFVESYGIPFLFLIMAQNAGDKDSKEFQAVVEQIASDSRGVLPHGSEIKTADPGNRGQNPFRAHLDYQDEQIVLAGTSGLLSMLSKPTGIGEGASNEHGKTFEEIALAQAMDISEILQEHFDKRILAEQFPGEERYVYFELAARDQEDVSSLFDNALKASQAGLAVDAEEMSEKSGLKLTRSEQGAESRERGAGIAQPIRNRIHNRDTPPINPAETEALARARLADHADLLALVDALEAADTPEDYAEAMAALEAAIEAREIDPAQSSFAETLEALLGSAVIEGAAEISEKATEAPTNADNA
ncbi:MAG: DUF935 family protein [Puniceicoccaceae bacterium]|nr:MAG: DUF935 family protein [Puniceicoccaceae bacterium]